MLEVLAQKHRDRGETMNKLISRTLQSFAITLVVCGIAGMAFARNEKPTKAVVLLTRGAVARLNKGGVEQVSVDVTKLENEPKTYDLRPSFKLITKGAIHRNEE